MWRRHCIGVRSAASMCGTENVKKDAHETEDDDDIGQENENVDVDEDLQFVTYGATQCLRRVGNRVGDKRRYAAEDR